ncbi:fatty acid elongase ELO2 [Ascoidea rubescens DSM 1968]|uniref:Elongation of fatty acids protein n=1 Tax=Ascoidea rubescens DSM 1968 TaxID=1344418 RepID=A0A1D2V8E1_9ASCO|nr:fatty acid elongase 2 [Ascoidea rubescens DSM 1968]ODV57961.1 fatty acid elongase 2 [Ascoidea rubescens DSM 1968]
MNYPIPSIDNPFGINLWDHFDSIISLVTFNKFVPSKFVFVPGNQLLSTLPIVLSSISLYYFIIFGGSYYLKKNSFKPLKLSLLFQLHNLILTSISFILLILIVEQLVPIIFKNGLFYSICNINSWTQPLITLYYLNYLTKFIEFIDTFFLVVKQKKLTFLHTYHHGATALLCFTQLIGETPISWVPISLNLSVHCLMYWYYFLTSTGYKVWWKEWVTRFQIIQFILDLIFVYFASYQKVAFTYFKDTLPYCADCAGSTNAAVWGCCILSSYLFLFIAFYIEVYKKKGSKKSRAVKRVKGGMAAKVNEYVNIDVSKTTGYSPSPLRSNISKKV